MLQVACWYVTQEIVSQAWLLLFYEMLLQWIMVSMISVLMCLRFVHTVELSVESSKEKIETVHLLKTRNKVVEVG